MVLTYAGRILGQMVGLVVSIILARILFPEDYGVIAVVMIFLNIADVFITDGFGNAIIQKKDVTNLDYSTIRTFSVAFSLFMYIGLFFSAPAIARFFNMPILVNVVRVLGLRLPLDAINSVQQAYVSRNMLFHLQLIASFLASIGSAVVGIIMAVKGMGVWALVAQYLINAVIMVISMRFLTKYRVGFRFSIPIFKQLFSYGWKLLVTQLISRVFNEFRSMAIGKMFSRSDLAFYQRGQYYPNLLMSSIEMSMTRVIFPVISRSQDNLEEVKRLLSKTVQLSCYIIIPFLAVFYAVSDKFVFILLTEKWMPSVPFIHIFCIYYMCTPINAAKYQAIKAIGRSDISLWCEIIQKFFGALILVYTIFVLRSVEAIAYGNWAFAVVMIITSSFFCKKYINLPYKQQIKDASHSIIIALIIIIPVLIITFFKFGAFMELLFQCVIAVIMFIAGSKVLRFHEYYQLKDTILTFVKRLRPKTTD